MQQESNEKIEHYATYFMLKYDKGTYNNIMQFHNWAIKEGFTIKEIEEMFNFVKHTKRKREMIDEMDN